MEGWGKVKQAAKYANVTEKTLRDWFKQGLRFSRPNTRSTLVKFTDIDEFLRSHSMDDEKSKLVDRMVDDIIKDCRRIN